MRQLDDGVIIEHFHLYGEQWCKLTKESICIRKDLNLNKHGSHFIVVGHQRGGRDVMWKDSIGTENSC